MVDGKLMKKKEKRIDDGSGWAYVDKILASTCQNRACSFLQCFDVTLSSAVYEPRCMS